MLVSRKNLPFIHFVPAEMTPCLNMAQSPHEGINILPAAGPSGKLNQPFAKSRIQGLALRSGYKSGLLNEVLIGT